MQAPNVCLVVAHGWNIIEYLLLLSAPLVGGWWWGEHAVGSWENRPLRLSSRAWHAQGIHLWWVCVCGVWVGGVWGVCFCGRSCIPVPACWWVWGWGCLVVDHGFFIVDASIWTSRS